MTRYGLFTLDTRGSRMAAWKFNSHPRRRHEVIAEEIDVVRDQLELGEDEWAMQTLSSVSKLEYQDACLTELEA